MKKNIVYFVLYLVVIMELLIVITERDELDARDHEIRDKMLNTLAEAYKQPLILSVPQKKSEVDMAQKEGIKVVLMPVGVLSEEDKRNLAFYVNVSGKSRLQPAGWPKGGVSLSTKDGNFRITRENGNAVFTAKFADAGEYTFEAYCTVNRQFPSYLPEYLMDILKEKVGNKMTAASPRIDFTIQAVRKSGGVNKKDSEMFF
ncbi:MAG: hypothetical protein HF314_07350 [Ignavibacteria bacterium]|nr:hypothetical protein [Ignavibacteria bacterium]MCU7502871.1 hypothetical protein [Ignavibacteria bacterium]MCU7515635.1 hypothetical protein [Ignavibacteria bacterium]